MSKITIEDISRHTGLSRGTVSRALNNRPDISVQTKQRVLEACRQLNYVPSHAARSLATGRCDAVAVVVDDLRSGYSGAFLRGVLASAQGHRFAVYVTELGHDAESAIQYLCMVANERVDSVLLSTTLPDTLGRRLKEVMEARPLVSPDPLPDVTCDVISPDYVEAGRLVAQHVLRNGATDVAYVHEGGTPTAERVLAGFQEVCRGSGIDPEQVTLHVETGASERLQPLVDRLANLRAVAASNDYLAIEIMGLVRGHGRRPGDDIAIMGQGNEFAGARIAPSLTTIDFCGEEIGRRALETMVQRVMKLRQDAPETTRVAPQLVARETTRTL